LEGRELGLEKKKNEGTSLSKESRLERKKEKLNQWGGGLNHKIKYLLAEGPEKERFGL